MIDLILLATPANSAPVVVAADTVFLMHFEGANGTATFLEEAGNVATVTAGPTLTNSVSKFGSSSGYFWAAGRVAFSDSPLLRLTGEYTIEGWIWIPSANMTQNTAILGKGTSFIQLYNGNLYLVDDTGGYKATGALDSAETWNHFAFTRDASGQSRLFINGKLKQQVAGATTFGSSATSVIIGSSDGYNVPLRGFLDDIRFSRTCLYTANFTPPTAPFPPFVPTKALLHFEGTNGSTTFTDELGHTFTAQGAAALSTTKSKFGGSSLRPGAAGTTAGITSPDHTDYRLTGDFTIEFWMNADNSSQSTFMLSKGSQATIQWWGGTLKVTGDQGAITGLTGVPTYTPGTWMHVAVTKESGVWRLFANGVKLAEVTSSYTFGTTASTALVIGGGSTLTFQGYLDEFRIVKNKALYTAANFTPPAAPFSL